MDKNAWEDARRRAVQRLLQGEAFTVFCLSEGVSRGALILPFEGRLARNLVEALASVPSTVSPVSKKPPRCPQCQAGKRAAFARQRRLHREIAGGSLVGRSLFILHAGALRWQMAPRR